MNIHLQLFQNCRFTSSETKERTISLLLAAIISYIKEKGDDDAEIWLRTITTLQFSSIVENLDISKTVDRQALFKSFYSCSWQKWSEISPHCFCILATVFGAKIDIQNIWKEIEHPYWSGDIISKSLEKKITFANWIENLLFYIIFMKKAIVPKLLEPSLNAFKQIVLEIEPRDHKSNKLEEIYRYFQEFDHLRIMENESKTHQNQIKKKNNTKQVASVRRKAGTAFH